MTVSKRMERVDAILDSEGIEYEREGILRVISRGPRQWKIGPGNKGTYRVSALTDTGSEILESVVYATTERVEGLAGFLSAEDRL